MDNIAEKLKLYLVVETSLLKVPLQEFIIQCYEAGVTSFQLRDKFIDTNIIVENAFIFKDTINSLKGDKPLFIINDRVDIANIVKANGVHLGIKDIPIYLVKASYPHLIIGSSCNNLYDVENANKYADYVGIGPAFFTDTKKDLRSILGIDGIKNIISHLKVHSVAIGGINKDNVSSFKNIGINGIAVSSSICKSDNPYNAVKEILLNYE